MAYLVLGSPRRGLEPIGNRLSRLPARQRFHNETGTGALGTPTTGVNARVSYMGMYYDLADRLTASVNVGTNGGTSWTRPGSVPARSDTVLVTSQSYNAAGWVESVTDPRGLVSRTEYDALQRVTKSVQNYTNGIVTDNSNKTVAFTYNGNDQVLTLRALLTGGGYQETGYVYGVSPANGSTISSNDILRATQHSDPTTGNASASEQDTYTVNNLSEVVSATDRNGTTHTYGRDVCKRSAERLGAVISPLASLRADAQRSNGPARSRGPSSSHANGEITAPNRSAERLRTCWAGSRPMPLRRWAPAWTGRCAGLRILPVPWPRGPCLDLRSGDGRRLFSERPHPMPKPFKPVRPYPLHADAEIVEHDRMTNRGSGCMTN